MAIIYNTNNSDGFFRRAEMGFVPGWRAASWFGYSKSVGTTRVGISPGAFPVTFPAAATKLQCTSANANDTAAGTGARKILITGLNSEYEEITEEVALTGQTAKDTVAEFLRVNGIVVVEAGSGGVNAGNIWLSVDGATLSSGVPSNDADKVGIIAAGDNKSAMAWATVPKGCNAQIKRATVSVAPEKSVDIEFFYRDTTTGLLLKAGEIELSNTAQESQFYRTYPEKTDIVVTGKASLASSGASVYYSYLLYKVADNG